MIAGLVIIISIILACVSPFIGVGIGIHFNEDSLDVAMYGILSTSIIGLIEIIALVHLSLVGVI